MTKTRFSISVDDDYAALIRAAAARAGEDVSTYMWRAALVAVERDARIAEIFADVDERVAAAEGVAEDSSASMPLGVGELPEAEQAEIVARWEAFFGASSRGAA